MTISIAFGAAFHASLSHVIPGKTRVITLAESRRLLPMVCRICTHRFEMPGPPIFFQKRRISAFLIGKKCVSSALRNPPYKRPSRMCSWARVMSSRPSHLSAESDELSSLSSFARAPRCGFSDCLCLRSTTLEYALLSILRSDESGRVIAAA